MTILGITGHRPKSLNLPYDIYDPAYNLLGTAIINRIEEIKPDSIITGMALGVDQLVAVVATELKIPFVAAVPFQGQENIWPAQSQHFYKELLTKAEKVVIVSEGGYSAEKLYLRNEYIVDNSDVLLAVWNGQLSGGTYAAMQYAVQQNKRIVVVNPKEI
jgi:uncharacterized phage-like protein YoqJ